MNTNMRIAITALMSVSSLLTVYGQESLPGSQVRDSMGEERVAPSEIPSTAPRERDINRLFNDSNEEETQAQAPSGGISTRSSSASPLATDVALDATDLISVDYPSEEIRTVLRNVADLYMLNLVVPHTLQGTASIKLRDVTWRQIFAVVLDPVGYTFIEEGSIVKVVSRETLDFEPPVTEIFMLNYATAREIVGTVNNLVDASKGGRVQVDDRTNSLIVSERASRMEELRDVVDRLDKPTQQVYIETRFVEVGANGGRKTGVNWAGLGGNVGGVSESGAVTIGANYRREALQNLGTIAGFNGTPLTQFPTSVFTRDQFGFVLTALETSGGSRLISNPTVVTLNNVEATINIGEEYPIPQYRYNQETGGFEVSGFEYKPIGVNLKVRPSINHSSLITLTVTPEVSSRSGTVNFGGASGAQIPIISNRTTSTRIALKDGYTMGIGGLIQSSEINETNRVPVLGRVPGIGRLFRHDDKDEDKLNLLIFITARILAGEEADFEDVFSQEMMEDAGVDPISLKNR